MTAIKAWLLSKGIGFVLGGVGAGAVFLAAKKFLPGFLAGLVGKKIASLSPADKADKALVLALVKWAEAKVPDRGAGKDRFVLVADKLVSIFPALKDQRDHISDLIEECVWRMDEELRRQGQMGE